MPIVILSNISQYIVKGDMEVKDDSFEMSGNIECLSPNKNGNMMINGITSGSTVVNDE